MDVMATTYSPHLDAGVSIQLSSPSHASRIDPQSAIQEIRRSLSRSPSRASELRTFQLRSMSPANKKVPFSPSPLSPSRRSPSDNLVQFSSGAPGHSSQYFTPNGPNSRFPRPLIRKTAHMQTSLHARTSPNSPSKRVLADSSDGGNSSPMPVRKRNSAEADRELTIHSGGDAQEKENEQKEDTEMIYKFMSPRKEKRRSGGCASPLPPASPLKRHDGPMNLDEPGCGTPSTKRRSLHGPTSGIDFSIFSSENLDSDAFGGQRRAQDDNDWYKCSSSLSTSRFSTIPKRSSSLRKSTLQQRQMEKPGQSRLGHAADLEPFAPAATSAFGSNLKKATRPSLDNHIPPMQRESPFSSQGSLLSASIHPVASASSSQQSSHPLSRTMTQSSTASSIQDDSPTHEPVHRPNRPRSHDFSKSLPIGAARPTAAYIADQDRDSSSQGSFATPGNYKSAKPLPAAFMSTGLISKKNRNVEDPNGGLPKSHMPDTPCKKQPSIFPPANYKPGQSFAAVSRARESFGTPSTPFGSHGFIAKPNPLPFAKSIGIFGNNAGKPQMSRKVSFASIDPDEYSQSQGSEPQVESQSTDSDYPPTPTKHAPTEQTKRVQVPASPQQDKGHEGSHTGSHTLQGPRFLSSKLSPIKASPGSVDGDSDSVMEDSPSVNLRPKSSLRGLLLPKTSYTYGRGLKSLVSPTPLSRKAFALAVSPFHSPNPGRTKFDCLSPDSPRAERHDGNSPHTPQEGFFPPDPSGLSISARNERFALNLSSSAGPVPATPTGPRDYFPNFSNRPSLNLGAGTASDIDQILTSKFGRVELVGTGEFSQVYRVSQPPPTSPFHNGYSLSGTRSSSHSSLAAKVFAVKKSRYPYTGTKDRQRKIHEVDVLKALGHSDHVLTFLDSWEEHGHLYIQTEFCEEGTLDVFLAQMGLKARLDDFRIWKILLELAMVSFQFVGVDLANVSQGLRHIHESGFIHLDLKPANVLITFEGVLRIADFGMAAKWPAKAGIEGEGDREYIGPEILQGRYDKPADIFALGLIMLETAANVELPDNGASWQKLRNGDMTDVPSLTWSSEESAVFRDASGNPLPDNALDGNLDERNGAKTTSMADHPDKSAHLARRGELVHPPDFMIDPNNEQALDRVVRWMISPNPADRPVAASVLQTVGVQWAEIRRRAGATVFEGNWGPADEILAEDAEMIDV